MWEWQRKGGREKEEYYRQCHVSPEQARTSLGLKRYLAQRKRERERKERGRCSMRNLGEEGGTKKNPPAKPVSLFFFFAISSEAGL